MGTLTAVLGSIAIPKHIHKCGLLNYQLISKFAIK
jgi:hypothetical protein